MHHSACRGYKFQLKTIAPGYSTARGVIGLAKRDYMQQGGDQVQGFLISADDSSISNAASAHTWKPTDRALS